MNAIIYCETISQDTQSGDYFSECEIHLEIEGDDFEDLLHSIKNAYICWLEWSSSDPRNGDWLVSESEIDMHTGDYEIYTLHFEEVLTDTQIKRITKALNL